MNYSLCREFISHLDKDGGLKCGNSPKHVGKWLKSLGLPWDLLRFMQWEWPQSDCYLEHIYIKSSASLHADEATTPMLIHKFLNVGSAPNGDWFVIDFSTEVVLPKMISLYERAIALRRGTALGAPSALGAGLPTPPKRLTEGLPELSNGLQNPGDLRSANVARSETGHSAWLGRRPATARGRPATARGGRGAAGRELLT
jgi:hypothetical protein